MKGSCEVCNNNLKVPEDSIVTCKSCKIAWIHTKCLVPMVRDWKCSACSSKPPLKSVSEGGSSSKPKMQKKLFIEPSVKKPPPKMPCPLCDLCWSERPDTLCEAYIEAFAEELEDTHEDSMCSQCGVDYAAKSSNFCGDCLRQ